MQTLVKAGTIIVLATIFLPFTSSGLRISRNNGFENLTVKNGSTLIFTSVMDDSVITVHKNGDVTTEPYANSAEQRWTVVEHPFDSEALEFKHELVPYNMLSGYQDSPENPGIFPRPLGLAYRGAIGKVETWNILIRGRWCLQANGYGYTMDIDDCESFVATWQLWKIEQVS